VPVGRVSALDSALTLARSLAEIWPGELADVIHSGILHNHNVAATPHHGPNPLANAWSNALICLIPGR
jgi:hypothetical protein